MRFTHGHIHVKHPRTATDHLKKSSGSCCYSSAECDARGADTGERALVTSTRPELHLRAARVWRKVPAEAGRVECARRKKFPWSCGETFQPSIGGTRASYSRIFKLIYIFVVAARNADGSVRLLVTFTGKRVKTSRPECASACREEAVV